MLRAEADAAVGVVVCAEFQAVGPALLVVDIGEGRRVAVWDGWLVGCRCGCR